MVDGDGRATELGVLLSTVVLHASQCCAYLSDSLGGCIQRVTRPKQLFQPAPTGLLPSYHALRVQNADRVIWMFVAAKNDSTVL